MTRWIVVVLVLAAAGVGLVWLVRGGGKGGAGGAGAATSASPAGATVPPALPEATADPARTPPTLAPRTPPTPLTPFTPPSLPARDLDRERGVRTRLDAVLHDYPDLAEIKTLECTAGGACRVELEVTDLRLFAAPYERLQEPGAGGFADEHGSMVLSKPVALGAGETGPFLVSFQLTAPLPDAPPP